MQYMSNIHLGTNKHRHKQEAYIMATLAEIRAKLKSQEVNRSTSSTGGDNAIYPHWKYI